MIPACTIVFDMDGVLVDTEIVSLEANRQAAWEAGVKIDDSVWHNMIGKRTDACKAVLFEEVSNRMLSDGIWIRANQLYHERIYAGDFEFKPGVEVLLDFLDKQSISWGIGTSSEEGFVKYKLTQFDIINRAHCIVSGNHVAYGKPSPDIYLEAAKRLNVEPQKCIVLEDSGPGLMAAHRAGMYPILIPDIKMPKPEYRLLAKHTFESLDVFMNALSAFLN